jgi:hypothetical protein
VGSRDDEPTLDADAPDPCRQLTDTNGGLAETNASLDETSARLDDINARLDRMELANEQRANRIDAQFERLAGLIMAWKMRQRQSRNRSRSHHPHWTEYRPPNRPICRPGRNQLLWNLCRSYPQAAAHWYHEASAVVYGDPGDDSGGGRHG